MTKQFKCLQVKHHGSVIKSIPNKLNLKKNFKFSAGSINYLFKLVGGLVSGWLTEPLGRKKSLLIVNIPHLIGWILLFNSSTLVEIFIVNAIFGIGAGLTRSPCSSYGGEIW